MKIIKTASLTSQEIERLNRDTQKIKGITKEIQDLPPLQVSDETTENITSLLNRLLGQLKDIKNGDTEAFMRFRNNLIMARNLAKKLENKGI